MVLKGSSLFRKANCRRPIFFCQISRFTFRAVIFGWIDPNFPDVTILILPDSAKTRDDKDDDSGRP